MPQTAKIHAISPSSSNPFDDYLTDIQLATLIKKHPRTLKRWDERRIGPPRITVGGKTILYSKTSISEWLKSLENRTARRRSR